MLYKKDILDKEKLYTSWKKEEEIAHIKGWDFSHIANRYVEEDTLPWDFKSVIKNYLKDQMYLLDMETGSHVIIMTRADSNDEIQFCSA